MLRRVLLAMPALAFAGAAAARGKSKPHPTAAVAPPPPPAAPSLVGAWVLHSAEILGDDGQPTPAFGALISGLLIYDRSGEMSLQIAGERASVGNAETFQSLSAEDKAGFLDRYYAYFGVFEVNEASRVVVHRVRNSLRPNEIGASYHRQYLIDGDRLTLSGPPEAHRGVLLVSRLVFVRA